MVKFWSFFVKRSSFSYLFLSALIIFGLSSIISIPKESAPEVQVPVGIVSTVFPGASAINVEELITNKVEDGLNNNLENLKKITSTSRESISIVVAEFEASADIDESIRDLKDEVDKIKPELPTNAEDPVVSDVNFADQPIMIISITADVAPTRFIDLADEVESELEKIRGVSRVQKNGVREREVQIVADKSQLSHFGLNLVDIVGAVARSNSSLPIGNISIDNIDYSLKFEGDIDKASEIEDIAIANRNGRPIYVRDVAFVSDGVEKATTLSRISLSGNPAEQAIELLVFKRRGGDVTKLTKNIEEKLEELKYGVLAGSEVLVSFDSGEEVKKDLLNLSKSGLQTIILVMIILFLAVGWREALIAGSAIPLSFLIGFIGLNSSGNTINFVSLFALILSVGILVDSAIVMVEGIHTKLKTKMDKKQAALMTIEEFNWPLISGTATTIAVFAPLFFISGVTGQFIYSIPFTIIFVLLASLLVALGIVPLIAATFMRRRITSQMEGRQEKIIEKLQEWYRNKLRLILGNKKREKRFFILITIAFIFAISLPIMGAVKVEFFPQEDIDWLYVEIEKPQGTVLSETDLATRAVEEVLYADDRIESFVTTIGASSSFGNPTTDTKLASITINLKEDRKEKSSKILEDIREKLLPIKTAEVRALQPNNGPPTGAPVLIQFFGDDFGKLESVANRAADILKNIPGATEVNTSTKDNNTEFVLSIDRARASEVGLDSAIIAQTLRAAIHGITATTIKSQGEDIDIVVKLNLNTEYVDPHDTNRVAIDTIKQINIETREGPIILGSLLETSIGQANAVIRHEDLKRVTSVTSELAEGATTGEVVSEFLEKSDQLELPDDITMKMGGEAEDVDESFRDMGRALIFGMILILAILILQFNSYRQAFHIIAIVPLSLIGIFVGLAITGKAVSFPSIMGFIALSGIVVNNSIILIDTMNKLRSKNPDWSVRKVVVEGSTLRLRPILLTTLTTVIGIIPLTFASELWAPLAFSIMFGLSFAVILTLVLVPVLYDRWPGSRKSM